MNHLCAWLVKQRVGTMILMIAKDIMILIMIIRISMKHLCAWLVNQDDDVDDCKTF